MSLQEHRGMISPWRSRTALEPKAPIPSTGPVSRTGYDVHGETNSPAPLETTYSAIRPKYQSEVALMHREQLPVSPTKNPGFDTGVLVS